MNRHLSFVPSAIMVLLAGAASAQGPAIEAPTTKPTGPAPSSQFDLEHWKLTLPYSNTNLYGDRPKEITSKQLVSGFKDPHFYSDASGAMVFWCPVVGSTTDGAKYSRCELREMFRSDDSRHTWTMPGTHVLQARCRLLQVPEYPKVVIGQIHSHSGKARPLVKIQYYKGRIEALVKVSSLQGKDKRLVLATGIELKKDIEWQIELRDGVLYLTVNGSTQSENVIENDKRWADQTFYFKAGAYPQTSSGGVSEGARVSFTQLLVSHKDDR